MTQVTERRAAWLAANRERLREYDSSPERLAKQRERARLRRERDPEALRIADRASAARCRQKRNATKAAWREANPGASTHEARWSYFRKAGVIPPWADRKAVEQFYRAAASARIVTGVEYQVDHVVPIRSPLVCGLHCQFNLAVIPLRANLAKSNRTWPDAP